MRIERLPLPDEPDEYLKTMQLLRRRYGAVRESCIFRARRADAAAPSLNQ